jgi:hypothetical protein
MPAGISAYVPLANITASGAVTTITFSSISQSYRDLILVIQAQNFSGSAQPGLRINGGTNSYNVVNMWGNGASRGGAVSTGNGSMLLSGNQSTLRADASSVIYVHLNDYSATNKFKTAISRMGSVTGQTVAAFSANENTSAVTTLQVMGATFISGSTFALYGVTA